MGQIYTVIAQQLHLRSSPELRENVIGRLSRGMSVEVRKREGTWAQVQSQRRSGWVSVKYLALATGAPLLPPSEEFPWMAVAARELGVKENSGLDALGHPLRHPRILEYLASVELSRELAERDETPWCSAFANWCVERSGYAGTNSALARSWLHWGSALERPRRGCIVVLLRPVTSTSGHVGLYVAGGAHSVTLLGGNQKNSVSYAAFPVERVLGYRVP